MQFHSANSPLLDITCMPDNSLEMAFLTLIDFQLTPSVHIYCMVYQAALMDRPIFQLEQTVCPLCGKPQICGCHWHKPESNRYLLLPEVLREARACSRGLGCQSDGIWDGWWQPWGFRLENSQCARAWGIPLKASS